MKCFFTKKRIFRYLVSVCFLCCGFYLTWDKLDGITDSVLIGLVCLHTGFWIFVGLVPCTSSFEPDSWCDVVDKFTDKLIDKLCSKSPEESGDK